MNTETTPPKPGLKTTEFWVSVGIAVVLVALAGVALVTGEPWAAAIFAVAAGAPTVIYIKGRGLLKAEAAKITDVIPDKYEPLLEGVVDAVGKLAPWAELFHSLVNKYLAKDDDAPPSGG